VTGSSNFKLEFVISHETSEQHLRSVGKQSVKENSTVNSAAAKIVQSLNKNVFNVTKTAFLSISEEAYCMQTEHVIRSISLL
jgi:hypothetical protein